MSEKRDETFRRQMKHMKHASETLAATPDVLLKHLRTKQLKHSKHAYETLAKKTPENT
jgi:hypothetical protein